MFHDLLSNSLFDLRQVEEGRAKLKNNKSIGPDGMSGVFLYAIRFSLLYLNSGVYPEILKLSSVTPIFTLDDISDVGNHQPITT